MAAPQVSLTDPKRYEIDTEVTVAQGETQVIINLPAAVPVGKIAKVRLVVRARLQDAP